MEMKEITFAMGRTINAGNYESVRVDVSGSARLGEGEDRDEVMSSLRSWVKQQLNEAVAVSRKPGVG